MVIIIKIIEELQYRITLAYIQSIGHMNPNPYVLKYIRILNKEEIIHTIKSQTNV